MNFMTFHILGMALSQLMSIFFRGVQTTKQLRFMTYVYRNVKKSGFGVGRYQI